MSAAFQPVPELTPSWVTPYERCPKCGGWKPASPNPHAPHHANGGLVDCVGDRIHQPRKDETHGS
jgi:hypothetical protein